MPAASMPLSSMDPNIQETEAAGRKRNHDEFSDDMVEVDADVKPSTKVTQSGGCGSQDCIPSSSDGSSAPSDAGSSIRAHDSPSPQPPNAVPAEQSTLGKKATSPDASTPQPAPAPKPAAKRKRLTAEEKEARDKEAADKKKQKEEQAAMRAAKKAKQEEEKAARQEEKEVKRKKKEEEDRAKAEKKRKRDEEKKCLQEAKDKANRCQKKMVDFLNTPKKTAAETDSKSGISKLPGSAESPSKPAKSAYDQLFKPFFVRKDVRWTMSTVQMDEETREARCRILDEFISGQRELERTPASFDAVELLRLPGKSPQRGRLHHPVRHIMETAHKETEKSARTGGGAGSAVEQVRSKLAKVPMKVIAFCQDVRPPYYGTMTFKPFALGRGNMYRLVRKTTDRRLPLDYDYDSEAEWQDEEGEDVDVDEDEDEQDDEDDMDGFLDDSEDAGPSRRVFAKTMEPESSGICFEDRHGSGSTRTAYENKMDVIIHEGLERGWDIDPWSAQYWEAEHRSKAAKCLRGGGPCVEKGGKMAPPPVPANGHALAKAMNQKLVKEELMNDVKKAILDNKALSKVGIVDYIFHQFRDRISRAEVKNTIELVATKVGTGRSKEWDLKPGHEIEL